MKLTVAVLLLAAVSHAVKTSAKNRKEEKAEKRELVEGNSGIEKRTPLFSTLSPAVTTAGVEYADKTEDISDKSPTQQIYATPVPQIAKISDVLTGQGPSYQAAIASHLYSPISIYQSRLGSPTTYEVSAPVPSQLAYSEHRLSIPSPNAIEYNSQQQTFTKPPINFIQPKILLGPSYEQSLGPAQSLIQHSNIPQPIQYNQPQLYQQQLQILQPQEDSPQRILYSQPLPQKQTEPNDIKSKSVHSQDLDKQVIQQDYEGQQQNAKSYASFTLSQSPPADQGQSKIAAFSQPQLQIQSYQQNQAQHYKPISKINYELQHPRLLLQQQPQINQQNKHVQIQIQQNPQLLRQQTQPVHYQIQPSVEYQPQGHVQQQLQYQGQPQIQYHSQEIQQTQEYQPQSQPIQYQQQQQQIQYQQPELIQYQQPQSLQYQQPQHFIQYQTQQGQPLQYPAPYHFEQQPYLFQQPQVLPQQYQPHYDISQIQSESKQSASLKPFVKQAPLLQTQISHSQASPQIQDSNYKGIPVLPTYPPVQYFGKFAQSIFGNYQH